MSLPLADQYNLAMSGWHSGNFDLLHKLLVAPDSVTPVEQRDAAADLHAKGGWLNAISNFVMDPTVWLAFFLSKRFPTSSYLKGSVPLRFIGTANEFSGLSLIGRTVEGFFRGTNIPKLTALKMKREAEVITVGNRIFDKLLSRPAWQEEMPIVSLLLEGQRPAGATQELHNLAAEIRSHMDELWQFLGKTQKVTGGIGLDTITPAKAEVFPAGEAPKYLRDYLPHIPLLGDESVLTISGKEALQRLSSSRASQLMEVAQAPASSVWSPTPTDRLGSNFAQYQMWLEKAGAEIFNPRLFTRQRYGIPLESEMGKELFVTDLNVILQKYIHSVARTYSLNAPLTDLERSLASSLTEAGRIYPTSDPIMVQVINEGLSAAGAKLARRPVPGTQHIEEYVLPGSMNAPTFGALKTMARSLRGDMEESEILFGNMFNAVRKGVDGVKGALGMKKTLQLEDAISTMERGPKDRDIMNKMTSYFYASTLGLNPLAWIKNLFQPALTTAAAIPMGSTLSGYKVLRERMPSYAREFMHQKELLAASELPMTQRLNLALDKAFHNTFPELAESGVRPDPRAFEMSEGQLIQDQVNGRARFKNFDSYMKFLLQPFTQTETANQVVTFYGAKDALRKAVARGEMEAPVAGAEMEQWLNFESSNLTNALQFKPGPGSRSVLQSFIPAPFRMFSSFPLRLINHFADSTVRGALTAKQMETAGTLEQMFGGRNWGTLARTYLIGKALTTGARAAIGVDLSDSVGLTGTFSNMANSGQLFAPIPVSPFPSAVISLAQYATTRDIKKLHPLIVPGVGEVPIPKNLIPGGIAISRAARALQMYRPDLGGFVDDNERLMYKADTTDFVLATLGIPLDKDRRMRQDMDRVESMKLRMKKYRREYAVAYRNKDIRSMKDLEGQWQVEFKDFGPLQISRQDLRRYEAQSRLTATSRMIQSMGSQGSFLAGPMYDYDPDLISPPPQRFAA